MNDQELKARAREVIGKCMFPAFATVDEHGCPQMRAMMPVTVGDDFTVYYVTSRMTAKCRQISANPKVSTLWTEIVDPMKDWRSVLIKGEAGISDDKALKERFWMEELRQIFPTGADDPNYVILVIKPTEMILADQATMPPLVVKL
jgi:general stress protein 26